MSNWYDALKQIMNANSDDFNTKVCTLKDEELKQEFKDGNGCFNSFIAWGENNVYFSINCDGEDLIEFAPRNPEDILSEKG
jgi:hypothetical protein